MTATERLRALLDERGVHWWAGKDERETLWESNGLTWEYFNNENGDAWLGFLGACEQDITPAQAIAATLGVGTCYITDNGPWGYPYVCSACGASFDPDVNNGEFNYCPNCGARLEDE